MTPPGDEGREKSTPSGRATHPSIEREVVAEPAELVQRGEEEWERLLVLGNEPQCIHRELPRDPLRVLTPMG